MPVMRNVFETCLRKTVVAVMAQETAKGDAITKLNSRLEPQRGLVDKVLDLYRLDGLAPFQELFG